MDIAKKKKRIKRTTRKTIAGIKLPPIERIGDSDIKTIVDVDPSFYSLVEGRPIRPNNSIHKYKQNIKEVAMKRTVHGFLVDEILRIDKEIEMERTIYETASKHFDEYQNSFDKFLAHDNNKTIAVMKKSDTMAKDLANQTEEQKKANFELATIRSKLQYIDETLSILLSFQTFLYKASPYLWQEKNKIKLDENRTEICLMNSNIFTKVDIDLVKERLSQLPPPQLYFEQPDQLLKVFGALEKQNLNYLLVTEELTVEKNKFLKALDSLKLLLKQELSFIEEKVKETLEIIKLNEIREIEVKEIFYRILEERIQYLVSSEMALQIFNYVEFAYEHLLAPNETGLSTLEMALALETEYDNLQLDISAFDLNLIKAIEKETYENSDKEVKQAKEAAKLLRDVDKLSRRMKSSFEPSRKQLHY
ncbi:uncharacterized protein LOC114350034 [Ostrinia furnacalis]|uniref:uncharacterized protein LOC114350034 n=1 Tax=Ostrinia furnacalis TaxID=93504 RepID=UPI00103C7AC9|nr:uncharacterized protein LOC114350034 [Ostrinia furnacalis]